MASGPYGLPAIHAATTSGRWEDVALPNLGFPRVGQRSAHHTGEVAREGKFPPWEIKFVNSVTGIHPG